MDVETYHKVVAVLLVGVFGIVINRAEEPMIDVVDHDLWLDIRIDFQSAEVLVANEQQVEFWSLPLRIGLRLTDVGSESIVIGLEHVIE